MNAKSKQDQEVNLKKAQEGDQEAFTQLMTLYQDTMYAIAYRMMRDTDDAWDVVQEAFMAVWRSIRTFAGNSDIGTWLHTVTHHCALRALSKKRRAMAMSSIWTDVELQSLPSSQNVERYIQDFETQIELEGQIARLPKIYQGVIYAYYMYGISRSEMAELFSLPAETIKTRISRGLKRLRAQTLKETAQPESDEYAWYYLRQQLVALINEGTRIRQRQAEEQLMDLERQLMISQDEAYLWAVKAMILTQVAHNDEALLAIRVALLSDPNSPVYLWIQGLVLIRLRHFSEAKTTLVEVLSSLRAHHAHIDHDFRAAYRNLRYFFYSMQEMQVPSYFHPTLQDFIDMSSLSYELDMWLHATCRQWLSGKDRRLFIS